MIKSHWQAASLLCATVLIAAGAVSAQTGGISVPALAGRPTAIQGLTSAATNSAEQTLCQMLRSALRAVNGLRSTDPGLEVSVSLLPTIWSGTTNWWWQDGDHKDKDQDKDKDRDRDRDKHKHPRRPAPTPEPSTLLSFGAALVIGAGVFLLGRLRRKRA